LKKGTFMEQSCLLIDHFLDETDNWIVEARKYFRSVHKLYFDSSTQANPMDLSPNKNFTETKKSSKSYATDKCPMCGKTKTKEATTCYDCYLKTFKRKTS
jgi:hypothetical protein